MKILIVDDYFDNILALTMLFKEIMGYEVLSASNGVEAYRIFMTESDIDIVLTDLEMPLLDGIGLIKKVKTVCPNRRVVLMSGSLTNESRLEATAAGADAILSKPMDIPTLIKAVAFETVCGA